MGSFTNSQKENGLMGFSHELIFYIEWLLCIKCRNPTLAKCGGEAQHLEKVRIWSPSGLSNV
jgi:hypothetical protein